jgi:hypothetical protein
MFSYKIRVQYLIQNHCQVEMVVAEPIATALWQVVALEQSDLSKLKEEICVDLDQVFEVRKIPE